MTIDNCLLQYIYDIWIKSWLRVSNNLNTLHQGSVNVCLDSCLGVQCSNGQRGFGRRRREVSDAADPNKVLSILYFQTRPFLSHCDRVMFIISQLLLLGLKAWVFPRFMRSACQRWSRWSATIVARGSTWRRRPSVTSERRWTCCCRIDCHFAYIFSY